MPKRVLKNEQGDTFTITLDEGKTVGSTMRERGGKFLGGTFSAKTYAAALKLFERMIEEEKEYGYFDPKEKNSTKKEANSAVKVQASGFTGPEIKKWWKALSREWQEALNEAVGHVIEDEGFEVLASLTEFEAHEAELADLSPLSRLTCIEYISLYGNSFSDLQPLVRLKNLRSLEIDNCSEVEDLTPLAKLKNLEELNIGYTSVTDLKPVYGLKKLKPLDVAGLDHQFENWESELEKLKKALPKCRISTAD